jgi:hypothetical protein
MRRVQALQQLVRMVQRLNAREVPTVKTYPIKDETGQPFAVEVEVAYCGIRSLAQTIASVEGVADVRVCKPFSGSGDVRAKFRYQGDEFAVVEPFGDNSRYWIGPVAQAPHRDVSPIESQLKAFRPSLLRRVVGDLVTFNFGAQTGK